MKWLNLVQYLLPQKNNRRQNRRATRRHPPKFRPLVETLECRLAPAAPATPNFSLPFRDGVIVPFTNVQLETNMYFDPDGDAHASTDWELFTANAAGQPQERIWTFLNASGQERIHTDLGDGTFIGSHAGRTEPFPDTLYVAMARHRDARSEVSTAGSRFFRTSAVVPGDPTQLWGVRQLGFVVEPVATGFQLPVSIAFVPNAGTSPSSPLYYVTELYGAIKVVTRDGTVSDYATGLLNFNPTGAFPGSGEQGVGSIVVDPASGDVFITQVYSQRDFDDSSPHFGRVVRLHSNDGGRTAATRTTILDTGALSGFSAALEAQGQSHQISNITIGPDGFLYVHNGEGFDVSRAQNLNSFGGKILRMTLNGDPIADNPFFDGGTLNARDYIFALGLRNPFGGAWRDPDPSVGRAAQHFTAENGPENNDRLSLLVRGRNYLWNGSAASMLNFATYTWSPPQAPVNMAFAQQSQFGGSQWAADRVGRGYVTLSGPTYGLGPQSQGKRIQEFVFNNDGTLQSGPTTLIEYTGTGRASVSGIAFGPDGMYFTDLYRNDGVGGPIARGANVWRVRFVGAADFSFSVPNPAQPQTIQFTDMSNVPGPNTFLWNFGDNTTSTERNPLHTYAAPGLYNVTLTVTGPGGSRMVQRSVPVNVAVGFNAQYFNLPGGQANPDQIAFFTSVSPALTRIDSRIDLTDASGPVVSAGVTLNQVQRDDFSVRWTGRLRPRFTETYTFRTNTDDGVRLWVNNQLIINNWTLHGPTNDLGMISLTAGMDVDIKMEFFERGGGALAQLFWRSASQPEEFVPANQVFPTQQSTALTPPARLRVLTATQTDINLDWFDDSDNETGFKIERSQDGGPFIVIQTVPGTSGSVATFTDRPTVAASYTYRVRSTNAFGDSIPSNTVTVAFRVPVAPSNLRAGSVVFDMVPLLWNDNSLNEIGFRIERSTNGSAFVEAGTVGTNVTTFTDIVPTDGTHVYRVQALGDSANSAFSNTVTVVAGPRQANGFRAEYFNLPAGQATIPQNIGFFTTSAPILVRSDGRINVEDTTGPVRSDGLILPTIQRDDFSVRWIGNITVPSTGSWRFRSNTDDGVRVWVNNTLIINNWTLHGPTLDDGFINLEAGVPYDIKMEFFERGGGALAQLFWQGPGVTNQLVPASAVVPIDQSIAITPPVRLRLLGSDARGINLDWIDDSDNETDFLIERSRDGGPFEVVNFVPANTTTFSDRPFEPGTYNYRVRGANHFGVSIPSNVVGAIMVGDFFLDKSNGFAVNSDLVQNGGVAFVGSDPTVARLTPNVNNRTASLWTNKQVAITNFSTSFDFQIHAGTNPPADGITFTIHNDPRGTATIGTGGGALGYQGIARSVAIKFDIFDGGTADPSDSTTGLFINGQGPFGGTDTLPFGLDFRSGRIFHVDISYVGTQLHMQILDLTGTTHATTTLTFTVDIPAIVGGDTAYIGFTGATGGLNANHDIRTWTYDGRHVPRSPSNLRVTSSTSSSVALAWTDNSWNEFEFIVERSLDMGQSFQEVGRVPADVTTFTDTTSGRGLYRVIAVNASGPSGPSNNAIAGPATIDFTGGFANPTGLSNNGRAAFVGGVARLTPAVGDAAGSIFSTTRVGIRNFSTSFTFRNHGGSAPPADGMTFTIHNDPRGPTALGRTGTGLGYGQENPGEPLSVGIANSVAVKFDLFQGFMDPSASTTGLFTNGQGPFGGIDTLPLGIDFRLPDVFQVDMTYNGSVLRVMTTNTRTGVSMVQNYNINIAATVGGDTAFVGFTAGTGGLTSNHDVQTWRFDAM